MKHSPTYKVIKSRDIPKVNRGSVDVQNLFPPDAYKKFSISIVEVVGDQKFGYSTERDGVYFVLKGEGEFFIEDDRIAVEEGDLIFIPKGVKYKDSGRLTLLAISVPRFDLSKWVTVEG